MSKSRAKLLVENDKDFANTTERAITFFELYIEGGDPKKAWVDAGYSEGSVRQANKKIRENYKLVEKMINAKIGAHVPMALNGIILLATHASSDAVKLKAQQDILYRAGYDKPIQIETLDAANKLDNKALEDELTKLLAKANKLADEKDITDVTQH